MTLGFAVHDPRYQKLFVRDTPTVREYSRGSIPSCRRSLGPEERLREHVTSTSSKYMLGRAVAGQSREARPRQTLGTRDRADGDGHFREDGLREFPRDKSVPRGLRSPDKKSRARVENVSQPIRESATEPSAKSSARLVRWIIHGNPGDGATLESCVLHGNDSQCVPTVFLVRRTKALVIGGVAVNERVDRAYHTYLFGVERSNDRSEKWKTSSESNKSGFRI